MEKARCNTELYSNLSEPLNNVKPSNFWGSHHRMDLPGYRVFENLSCNVIATLTSTFREGVY